MLSTIQLFSLIASFFWLGLILWNVRERRISEAYALFWIISAILMIVLSLWIDCLKFISDWLGIVYLPSMLFLFLICCIILVLFQYLILLTKNQKRIKCLVQEIALLKQEIETLKNKK